MYGVTLDELVGFDVDIREIQEVIDKTSEEVSDQIGWERVDNWLLSAKEISIE